MDEKSLDELLIDFKPNLTLASEPELSEPLLQEKQPEEHISAVDDHFTQEEKKMVKEFVEQIDLANSNMVLQYGSAAQKKIATFSETALNNIQTKDLGEIGHMLTDLVNELKGFDMEEEQKGLKGLFKKSANKVTAIKSKYDKAEVNVNKICSVLEGHQVQLFKDIALLDKMYELNLHVYCRWTAKTRSSPTNYAAPISG